MRRAASAILLLLLLVSCGGGGGSTPTDPGPAPGTASYRVLLYGFPGDGSSTALANATVRLRDRVGTTNELGRVQFDGLALGDATVTFEKAGWRTHSVQIHLLSGLNVYTVQLQPSS